MYRRLASILYIALVVNYFWGPLDAGRTLDFICKQSEMTYTIDSFNENTITCHIKSYLHDIRE